MYRAPLLSERIREEFSDSSWGERGGGGLYTGLKQQYPCDVVPLMLNHVVRETTKIKRYFLKTLLIKAALNSKLNERFTYFFFESLNIRLNWCKSSKRTLTVSKSRKYFDPSTTTAGADLLNSVVHRYSSTAACGHQTGLDVDQFTPRPFPRSQRNTSATIASAILRNAQNIQHQ